MPGLNILAVFLRVIFNLFPKLKGLLTMDDLSRQMLSRLASLIEAETGALSVKLPREYSYKSLPMALVDAVFSIGVKYRAVENTVERFCLYQSPGWAR